MKAETPEGIGDGPDPTPPSPRGLRVLLTRGLCILLVVVVILSVTGIVIVVYGSNSTGLIVDYVPWKDNVDFPLDIAYDSNNGDLYTANTFSNNITVINGVTDRVVGLVEVEPPGKYESHGGGHSNAVTVAVASHQVFVSAPPNLTVIDDRTNEVHAVIPGMVIPGNWVQSLAYDSINKDVYVAHAPNVTVIDPSNDTVVASIHLGGVEADWGPMAFDSLTNELLVAQGWPLWCVEPCQDTLIQVISGSTNAVTSNFTVPSVVDGMAVDTRNGDLYIDCGLLLNLQRGAVVYGAAVLVYDLSNDQLITRIPMKTVVQLGADHNMVFSPANGFLYAVTTSGPPTNDLTVIDGSTNTVVGTIGMGGYSSGVALDSATGNIFVATIVPWGITVVSPETTFVGVPQWQPLVIFGALFPSTLLVVGSLALLRARRKKGWPSDGPRVLSWSGGIMFLFGIIGSGVSMILTLSSQSSALPSWNPLDWYISGLLLLYGIGFYIAAFLWRSKRG